MITKENARVGMRIKYVYPGTYETGYICRITHLENDRFMVEWEDLKLKRNSSNSFYYDYAGRFPKGAIFQEVIIDDIS